jgi:actin-related protein
MRGVVTNWDDMEKIWHHTFYDKLGVDTNEHPVLMASPLMNRNPQAEKMTEILFESFEVKAFCVAIPVSIFKLTRTLKQKQNYKINLKCVFTTYYYKANNIDNSSHLKKNCLFANSLL